MVLTPEKPCCKHKDPRPIAEEKMARLNSAIKALDEKGPISGDEFYAKFANALAKKK